MTRRAQLVETFLSDSCPVLLSADPKRIMQRPIEGQDWCCRLKPGGRFFFSFSPGFNLQHLSLSDCCLGLSINRSVFTSIMSLALCVLCLLDGPKIRKEKPNRRLTVKAREKEIVCKVRTQQAENFDEEVKSLVSAWFLCPHCLSLCLYLYRRRNEKKLQRRR